MIPKIPTPEGWSKVRGRTGYFKRPMDRAWVIWSPHFRSWWLEAPRGHACDWWGPWETDDESVAMAGMRDLYDRLGKIGWFDLKADEHGTFAGGDMIPLLAKVPRSNRIPSYFLGLLDRTRARNGDIRGGRDTLEIGGADLHVARHADPIPTPESTVRLVAKPAGATPRSRGIVEFDLDCASLDAMIDFLVEARSRMVSEDTFQGIHRLMQDARGDLPEGVDRESPEWRRAVNEGFARRIAAARAVGDIMEGIVEGARERPEGLPILAMVLQILGSGDRIAGIQVAPGGDGPYEIDVKAGPDTQTGRGMHFAAAEPEGLPN